MKQKVLSQKFANSFNKKDTKGISTLLDNDFTLYDPDVKCVKGKEKVISLLSDQFSKTNNLTYKVKNIFQEKDTTILEFQITLDDLVLDGVDFIKWKNNKMIELRCYYNSSENN
jgi:hypothetical protein